MDKLKLIKLIVFGLTFLLVFGSLVLLGSIFRHTRASNQALSAEILLSEAIGSRIDSITINKKFIYLLIKDGAKEDRVIILDGETNQPISKIQLQ